MTGLNDVKIRFVGNSKNMKTGSISQTYTSCNTCPARCPFKDHGCYAKQGPVSWVWKKTEKLGVSPDQLKEVIQNSCHTNVIRHNVAGDMATPETNELNEELVKVLCEAYKGLTVYTYTHCEINDNNIRIVKEAAAAGFIINFSTESIEAAKKAREAGCNAVIACNTISDHVVKHEGLTVVQCPATYKDNVQCQNCGMCWQKDRKVIPAFPVHGAGQKKAKAAGFLSDL